jgi:ribosomal protein L7/L12
MADGYYTDQEAQEILRLAARRDQADGGMSRERLIQAAAEMGIEPAAILAAESEVRAREEKNSLRKQYLEAKKRKFFGSTSSLVGTSIMLFGINYLTSGFHGLWSMWAIWPCGFMALGAAKEGWEFVTSRSAMGDEEFERWCAKNRRKQLFVEGHLTDLNSPTTQQAAREICAEYGPDHRDKSLEAIREQMGLDKKAAKYLVKTVYGEPTWVVPAPGQTASQALWEIAVAARHEHGPAKLNAIKSVRDKTGLSLAATKDLVDSVYRNEKFNHLATPSAAVSTYEAARQAISEAGVDHKIVAIHLLQQRTGISIQEATDAVEAVLELSH